MKTVSMIAKTSLVVAMAVACAFTGRAQGSKDKALVKALVDSQQYVFVAQTALPLSGHTRSLTPDYTLRVTKDAVVSTLPYFGQAYTAPLDPSKGGLDFKSSSFDYSVSDRKKGGWNITIKPKDNHDVQQLFLTISETGYASLQVNSTDRQGISFNGYVTAKQ